MNHPGTEGPTTRRRNALLAAVTGAAILVGAGAQFGLSGRSRTLVILIGLVALILAAFAASALRARQPGSESLGWKILSCSLFINGLIQASRIPAILGHPLPTVARNASILLQVLGTFLLVGALLAWHLTPRSRFDKIRHGLDGLLFALAVFFILWGVVLGPAFLSDRFSLLDRMMWLGTFLVYDLLLGLTVYFGLEAPSRFRGPMGWLAASFLLASLHNFVWLLNVLSGATLFFHLPVGPLIYAIPLAQFAAALSPRPVDARASRPGRDHLVLVLPYLPVLGATSLGIWLLATGGGLGHRIVLVWLALGLVVVLLVRQYVALRDFFSLSRHLETRVAERTLALEKAQALLLRTERMNSIATLGAGMAHDMNNLLGAIQHRAELVIMNLDEGKLPARKDMERVKEAAHLAATLSSRLMALGRQDPEPPQAMDLALELEAIQPLLQALLHKDQTLQMATLSGPMPFRGTRGMLEQVLVNLISNARDAMPSGGTITLRAWPAPSGDMAAGPLLEIEDTGSGIPEDLQDQVFQPFFTTKASGAGTGLGLVSVKSLLEKAGGAISFVTVPGSGTLFKIRLPHLP